METIRVNIVSLQETKWKAKKAKGLMVSNFGTQDKTIIEMR